MHCAKGISYLNGSCSSFMWWTIKNTLGPWKNLFSSNTITFLGVQVRFGALQLHYSTLQYDKRQISSSIMFSALQLQCIIVLFYINYNGISSTGITILKLIVVTCKWTSIINNIFNHLLTCCLSVDSVCDAFVCLYVDVLLSSSHMGLTMLLLKIQQ